MAIDRENRSVTDNKKLELINLLKVMFKKIFSLIIEQKPEQIKLIDNCHHLLNQISTHILAF